MAEEIVRELVDGEWVTRRKNVSGGGLPAGGTTGEVLTKASDADGDADWEPGGGSQTVFVQDEDPGAVGAGKLWISVTDDPPVAKVRNTADDGWALLGAGGLNTASAPFGTGGGDADLDGGDLLNVRRVIGEGGDWTTSGGNMSLGNGDFDTEGGNAHVDALEIDGVLNHDGALIGFNGATPVPPTELPAVGVVTVQDLIDFLVSRGDVTQAA